MHDLAMRLAGPVERDAALTDIVSTLVELNGARFGLLMFASFACIYLASFIASVFAL